MLAPAIEVVVESHIHQAEPIVIEGDGILPSLLERPAVRALAGRGVAAVFLYEPDEAVLLANILRRRRGIGKHADGELRTQARAHWIFGNWLCAETQRLHLPLTESRPWETLTERVLKAAVLDNGEHAR